MKRHRALNRVRIVGGVWRGRRLEFPAVAGLRPSGDRVRETLFNWLQVDLPGARCLDLFAGSGALGFEALSRGAARAVLVEADPQVAECLRRSASTLGASGAQVIGASAADYLAGLAESFDLVFVDPPFEQATRDGARGWCEALARAGALRAGARVYVERPVEAPPGPPEGWQTLREKHQGGVAFGLYRPPG